MSAKAQKQNDLRWALRTRGPLSAVELTQILKLSQPSFSRLVSTLPELFTVGESKNRRYALLRSTEKYPIVKISESGEPMALGELCLLQPKGAIFIPNPLTQLKPELFVDIPYFIWDLRPQGYLGKIFISQNPDLNLPTRWEDWQEKDLLRTLQIRGDDLAGNLIVGHESLRRFQQKKVEAILPAQRKKQYPIWADQTLHSTFVGSSAGGEQPKFSAQIRDPNQNLKHVLVKFSPPLDTKAGQRWADLLYAENLALNLLHAGGYAAAPSEILTSANRVFLEVSRFDRIGAKGRKGILSIGAIDDEFIGSRGSWTHSALRLSEQKKITKSDAQKIIFLDCFGALIANSDRHFGNLSFYWDLGAKKFDLAPAYDMLPMAYAPVQGNIVKRDFKKAVAEFAQITTWPAAQKLAIEFWQKLSKDQRVSASFRAIAKANAAILAA